MVAPLLGIPITTLIIIMSLSFEFRAGNLLSRISIAGSQLSDYIKIATLQSFSVSLAYAAYLGNKYPVLLYNSRDYSNGHLSLVYPSNSWIELHHNLNLPFLLLSTFILMLCLLTSGYANVNSVLLTSLLLTVEICLVGAFSCSNLFLFLLFFEASALPIFILIVYCGSPRRERLKASYYFLFFTLYGSISLLLLILNIYSLNHLHFTGFNLAQQQTSSVMGVLLFIAFAVKIPLFPFHLWLPYAHVEASTATSIILAALMLKLGGYGMLKFMLPLFNLETHLFFRPLALFVCVLGTIYGGLAALRQIDLKRQVAFSSIAHMSFATIGVFTFTEIGAKGAVYLMLSHGLSSAALFYLIGVLSDRYHTRSILAYGGLLSTMPMFCFFLLVASLTNVGFPGTSGFLPELFVLVSVVSISPFLLFPILFGMFLTTASTLIALLRLMFGHLKTYYMKSTGTDLTKLEFFVLSILGFGMILLGLYDVLNVSAISL